jgi:hypothetical protein
MEKPSDDALKYAQLAVVCALSSIVASDDVTRVIAYAYDAGYSRAKLDIIDALGLIVKSVNEFDKTDSFVMPEIATGL